MSVRNGSESAEQQQHQGRYNRTMRAETRKLFGLPSVSPYEQIPAIPKSPRKHGQGTRHKSLPKSKSRFRLSPEEQELSYELKASMMRKLNNQTEKINNELDMHKKLHDLKKQQHQKQRGKSASGSKGDNSSMSQTNAVKLMRMYEKRAKEAEARVKVLESELEESQALARRYRDMFVVERDRARPSTSTRSSRIVNLNHTPRDGKHSTINEELNASSSSEGGGGGGGGMKDSKDNRSLSKSMTKSHGEGKDRVTEDELDDDEALFKRHIAKIAEMKAMNTTSPIRIEDIIRKSEVLIIENDSLKREVQRLKRDNSELIGRSKKATDERDMLQSSITTLESARAEVSKRLDLERKQHQRLQASLTKQASDWVQARKEYAELEEKKRWQAVGPVSPYDAEQRALSHPVKKNIYMPRKMYPVDNYSATR